MNRRDVRRDGDRQADNKLNLDPARGEDWMHLDACIKCGACTAQCPVAAVYPLFPGPKSVGPDAERLRLEGIALAPGCLAYCTNCKTCEVTCPSSVRITDMILQVRRQEQEAGTGKAICRLGMRDNLLGRAEYLGRLGTLWPPLANTVLGWKITRRLLEKTLGISARAPLPRYGRKFRTSDIVPLVGETQSYGRGETESYRCVKTDQNRRSAKKVVYFPGCFISYNDEATGQAVVKVLEHNGFEVIVPHFYCCGVPLTANGRFREATANAQHNLGLMQPYLEQGIPVIASCTSCGLALKEDYPRVSAPGAQRIGAQTYDLFEFLWVLHERGELRKDFREVQVSLAYHAPCHLKAQGIGTPSVRILRLIPGVKIQELDAGCCGLSGSFGFKAEKYELALQIGSTLFQRVQEGVKEEAFQAVATECGGCQVQIEHGSGAPSLNPVWVLYQAYGLGISSAIG
ncbi:MAG: anaerobic glycerol-3-phosphate dehydrogenase subunit C [Desulfitobacteriaceae bacterium]|nr:anaerobic glycerol-3-phosphate dehydrogenase subunit C [Desulfitobacteriaceae bacterium]MDI6913403.1 anaerobic glycerol-3-phosphate dehydrogenase subunit C [Desulfitobacteriaceae bacterium]